jgi:tetratricopeptide (TPR) repeat protein
MNNLSNPEINSKSPMPSTRRKLSDSGRILRLASTSFDKGNYSLAIDYCRMAASIVKIADSPELAAEIYFIWCLSQIKLGKFHDARKVCYEARLKIGNYLDLVYFEILIASGRGEAKKIPRLVNNFLDLQKAEGNGINPATGKSHDRIGEVLLVGAEVLERANNKPGALEIYNKYLTLFPDDDSVRILAYSLSGELKRSNTL